MDQMDTLKQMWIMAMITDRAILMLMIGGVQRTALHQHMRIVVPDVLLSLKTQNKKGR